MEPGCGEILDNPQLLRTHTKAAHSFAFCETCGVSMLKKNLVSHARKHGEQELMRCPHPGCLHSYSKVGHVQVLHLDFSFSRVLPLGGTSFIVCSKSDAKTILLYVLSLLRLFYSSFVLIIAYLSSAEIQSEYSYPSNPHEFEAL